MLYLVADDDVSLPLAGMYELFDRTEATKRMIILRRADHMHFMDNVEEIHETVRQMTFPEELSWIPREMKPISELSSGDQAHLFVRGLTLAHMDAVLKQSEEARRFWQGDIIASTRRAGRRSGGASDGLTGQIRYGAPYLQSICSSGGSGCSFPHPSHINQYASPSSDTARLDPSQPLAMIVSPTISTSA